MSAGFTATLREAGLIDWRAASGHRFTAEPGAGTIAPDVMARDLVQEHRFLDAFLALLGAAIAGVDRFEARLRFARFAGTVAGEENTYFERAFEALGVREETRRAASDSAASGGFQAIMREAAATRSYAGALCVLTVAEWLYLDWTRNAPRPLPGSFVHAEWITLRDDPDFRDFGAFLRAELDRVGPAEAELCQGVSTRAVALERAFFDAAYEGDAGTEIGR